MHTLTPHGLLIIIIILCVAIFMFQFIVSFYSYHKVIISLLLSLLFVDITIVSLHTPFF